MKPVGKQRTHAKQWQSWKLAFVGWTNRNTSRQSEKKWRRPFQSFAFTGNVAMQPDIKCMQRQPPSGLSHMAENIERLGSNTGPTPQMLFLHGKIMIVARVENGRETGR
jgi:hypothetical protein